MTGNKRIIAIREHGRVSGFRYVSLSTPAHFPRAPTAPNWIQPARAAFTASVVSATSKLHAPSWLRFPGKPRKKASP